MVAHGDVGILRIIYNLELRIVLRISDNCVVKCAFDVDCDTVALLDGVFDRNEDLDDDVVLKLKAMEGIIGYVNVVHLLEELEIELWKDKKVRLIPMLLWHM